jgi:hypothetical protein
MTLRYTWYHHILLVMMAFLSKGGEGGQLTCMTGAVVKQSKSGQEYCDCSAVMSRDILAGKLVSKQSNVLDIFSFETPKLFVYWPFYQTKV